MTKKDTDFAVLRVPLEAAASDDHDQEITIDETDRLFRLYGGNVVLVTAPTNKPEFSLRIGTRGGEKVDCLTDEQPAANAAGRRVGWESSHGGYIFNPHEIALEVNQKSMFTGSGVAYVLLLVELL